MRRKLVILGGLLVLLVCYYIFFPYVHNHRVDDFANIYDEKEEKDILRYVNIFIKSSGIDFKYATVDNIEDYRNWVTSNENDVFLRKTLNKSGIFVVFVKDEHKIYTTKYGKFFSRRDYWKMGIFKFYEMKADENSIKYVIWSLAGYFIEKSLKILLVIIILTFIFSEILLKKLRDRYSILQIDDAKDYYNPSEINFL